MLFALENIIIGAWILFVVYWTIMGWSTKPTQQTKREIEIGWDIAGRIFLAFLCIESFGQFPFLPLTMVVIPHQIAIRWLGTGLVVIGVIIAIVARKTLAGNWSSNIEIKKKHELVTTGIYSIVRHPIYTGIGSMALGTFLFTGTISALLFFLIMVVSMVFKAREEEELLLEHFSQRYAAYKKRVEFLIPFIV